jgi:FkbM family methyltransferase
MSNNQSRRRAKSLLSMLGWRLHVLLDWFGTRVWRKTRLYKTSDGMTLRAGIHPAYRQMVDGSFEREEFDLLTSAFRDVDVFVDVGANIGYYSCLALRSGKRVVAFEPQRANLDCLFFNVLANDLERRFEVYPIALSDRIGLLELFGASGPSASMIQHWAGYSSGFRQVVPVNTLDNVLLGRFNGASVLVKIDVEGAEYSVLKGALDTLTRIPRPAWLIEVCYDEFHPEGVNPNYRATFELFLNNGYRAYAVNAAMQEITHQSLDSALAKGESASSVFNYYFVDAGQSLP